MLQQRGGPRQCRPVRRVPERVVLQHWRHGAHAVQPRHTAAAAEATLVSWVYGRTLPGRVWQHGVQVVRGRPLLQRRGECRAALPLWPVPGRGAAGDGVCRRLPRVPIRGVVLDGCGGTISVQPRHGAAAARAGVLQQVPRRQVHGRICQDGVLLVQPWRVLHRGCVRRSSVSVWSAPECHTSRAQPANDEPGRLHPLSAGGLLLHRFGTANGMQPGHRSTTKWAGLLHCM